MVEQPINAGPRDGLEISIVIPTRNRWARVVECLQSIEHQVDPPPFEVIVVDDGSNEERPRPLREPAFGFPLEMAEQPRLGVSAARNHGAALARGALLFFVDSDCTLERRCLSSLLSSARKYPGDVAFQARIVGDAATLIGCVEDLNHSVLQRHHLQEDGLIRWLNTAGFALRREAAASVPSLFDRRAVRGQDTLFLAQLCRGGRLPRFVFDALVCHAPESTLWRYVAGGFSIGYHGSWTRRLIKKTARIYSSPGQRFRLLAKFYKASRAYPFGPAPLSLLILRRLAIAAGALAGRVARDRHA